MTTSDDPLTQLSQPSSRNGRYWLRATRESESTTGTSSSEFAGTRSDPAHGLPFQGKKSSGLPFHESVVVSIPNVSEEANLHQNRGFETAAAMVAASGVSAVVDTGPVEVETSEDLTPSFTKPSPMTAESIDQAVEASRSLQNEREQTEIGKVANQIVEQFPLASPATVLFVGSEDSMHIDECCARVAAELASRDIGRILMIDSDFENRRLSIASGMGSNAGLSEIMNVAYSWKDAVLSSSSSKLDFIPAGTYANRRWNPDELLRDAVAEMRSEYQMICVAGGDAHGTAAKSWSQFCDGSYLVVSIRNSNERVAESAAIRLQQLGARLIGCIVTDVAP